MPTYEYRCVQGHAFEKSQRITEPPLEVCPVCGARAERLLSPGIGLLFKGSGFYITDYRSDSYRKAAAAESASSSDSAPKEGGAAAAPATESKESKSSKDSNGSKGPASRAPDSTDD
jgi:putative FmdB family regulatory protein